MQRQFLLRKRHIAFNRSGWIGATSFGAMTGARESPPSSSARPYWEHANKEVRSRSASSVRYGSVKHACEDALIENLLCD
ncbi:hypothetical protein D3C72_1476380 [compost metagenome]